MLSNTHNRLGSHFGEKKALLPTEEYSSHVVFEVTGVVVSQHRVKQ